MTKKRDLNIVKNYQREISLQTKVVRDRTKYTRKQKHKRLSMNPKIALSYLYGHLHKDKIRA